MMETPGNQTSGNEDAPRPVEEMTFEEALQELEGIVSGLEEGRVPLERSIAMYERGEALRGRCDDLLKRAEARIDKITAVNGQVTGTEPLDGD